MRSSDTVNLARIRRAHDPEEESVSFSGLGGEIVFNEEGPF
jgi:hypothetical protein